MLTAPATANIPTAQLAPGGQVDHVSRACPSFSFLAAFLSCCFIYFIFIFIYVHRLFYLLMSKQTKKCVCRPEENIPRFCRSGRHDLLVVACST